VVGNPAKISGAMLNGLSKQATKIDFIDRRYKFPKASDRIQEKFKQQQNFVVPKNHFDYLNSITKYNNFIDTYPYNCGLTCVEILILDLKFTEFTGKIFSSRHSMSHKISFIHKI
jgi:hypothetical protein